MSRALLGVQATAQRLITCGRHPLKLAPTASVRSACVVKVMQLAGEQHSHLHQSGISDIHLTNGVCSLPRVASSGLCRRCVSMGSQTRRTIFRLKWRPTEVGQMLESDRRRRRQQQSSGRMPLISAVSLAIDWLLVKNCQVSRGLCIQINIGLD